MRFNFKKLAITLALISAVPNVNALGLGEIKLNSLLNRPLDARIELLDAKELGAAEIIVSLANEEDFERVGVENVVFLSDLDFKVVTGQGRPYVKVTSSRPVVEPFLNFVVQARWPSGRLLREYTVLMDLPAFSDQKVKPVISAPTRQRTVTTPQPINRRPVQPVAPAPVNNTPAPGYQGETYRVQRGDTLSQIARRVKPGSATVNQTMVALKELNPDAFINGNINLLKRGKILRVPTSTDASQISPSLANQQINSAVREFRSSASQLDATASSSNAQLATGSKSGRVKVLAGGANGSGDSGAGSADQQERISKLEGNLNSALEQLDKAESEKQELQAKLASLQSQLEAQEKLVEISNESLQALEQNAAKLQEDAAAAEARAAAAADEAEARAADVADTALEQAESEANEIVAQAEEGLSNAESDVDEASDAVADAIDETSDEINDDIKAALRGDTLAEIDQAAEAEQDLDDSAQESVQDAVETTTPTPQPVVVAPIAQEKGLIDKLLDNILLIGGGLLALIAAIGGFLFLRNRRDDDEEYEFDDDEDFIDEPLPVEAQDDEIIEDDTVVMPHLAEDAASTEDTPEQVEEDDDDFETDDIVTEADIWIAYGKYDEAEEKLKKALRKEPRNSEVRVKLMEVYAAQGKGDVFDEQFARLAAIASPALIDRGGELRGTIAGLGEFDASQYDVSDVMIEEPAEVVEAEPMPITADDDMDLSEFDDLDLDILAEDDSVEGENATDEVSFDNSSLEADLGEELGSDDLGLDDDFELNLDTEESDSGFESASEGGDDLDDIEFALSDDAATLDSDASSLDLSDQLDTADSSTLDLADSTVDSNSSADGFGDINLDLEADIAELTNDTDSSSSQSDADTIDLEGLDDLNDLDGLDNLDNLDDLALELNATEETSLDDLSDLSLDDSSIDRGVGDLDAQLEAEQPSDSIASLDTIPSGLDDELASLDALPMDEGLDDLETLLDTDTAAETPVVSEAISPDDATIDELDALGDDMDLASLDSELDALTADLDTDLGDIDAELNMGNASDSLDDIPALTDTADDLIEKPVTDLDSIASDEPESELNDMGEDTMFNQAIAEVPASDIDLSVPDIDPESDDDSDLSFLSGSDQIATKLDLARAYIDMGDTDGANEILDEIMEEGNDAQKQEAISLRERLA